MQQIGEFLGVAVSGILQEVPSLASAGIFFLAVSLIVNRSLQAVLRKMAPSSLRVNVLTYLFNALFVAVPLGTLILWLQSAITEHQFQIISTTHFGDMPTWLALLFAVFCGDAIGYFRHRLEHTVLLWPFHALHHSDTEMTWFTLFRFHPINRVSTAFIDIGVLLIIGIPLWAVGAQALVRHYYGMLVHADVPWTYGPLGRVFVSPAMHRWHHARKGQGMHSNYATIFAIFDYAFGTYYLPGPCKAPLGAEGMDDRSFSKQILLPFTELASAAAKISSKRLDP